MSDGRAKRWGWAAIGTTAAATISVGVLMTAGRTARDIPAKLTHIVKRGDLIVTVTEQGLLESSENTEIKCKVRGRSTVIWVIDSGTRVKPGDALVRLDTLAIEDAVSERTKYAHWSRSSAERSRATVARAELAIPEYLEGRYRTELMNLEKELADAESNLRTARDMLAYYKRMSERGYVSDFDVEKRQTAVAQAELNTEVKQTEIGVLEQYAKAMELETLQGNLKAAKANLAAAEERSNMDAARRDLASQELQHCVVTAEEPGFVIHPSAARWHNAPPITEGAIVHKDQVLLLMPDLSRMQVKVGFRESVVPRIRPGMRARITLPDGRLDGEVSSVASVAAPAAIWSGNVVRYETLIKLPSVKGLKPGMSAEVEVIVDRYADVLTVPVAAIMETSNGPICWVKTSGAVERRKVKLGDTNDVLTIVQAGVNEGEEVMLNPLAFMDKNEFQELGGEEEPEPRGSSDSETSGNDADADPTEPRPAKNI